MFGENTKDIFNFEIGCAYTPNEKWIGLRPRNSNEKKEEWRNREGIETYYQLNLIPCLGLFFSIVRWKKIEEKKKKK